jgi:hypothetical protein
MPRKLRRDLPEFFIRTAQEEGCSAFKNGELLRRVSPLFQVLISLDQSMQYQQNLTKFDIGLVVIDIPDTRLRFVRELLPEIRDAIQRVLPGEVIVIRPA